jgi:hypothetical protein
MPNRATTRKIKCSFTLSPESVTFLHETRKRRKVASDSEALDLLIRDNRLAEKQAAIDAAYKEYYDTVSDEVLAEEREWAELTAPNMWVDIPE